MPPPRSTNAPKSSTDVDPAGQHRAGHDRLAHFGGARLLLLFEVLAARDDDVLAAVLVLDDAEGVDLALVHRRIGGADDVDLRQRTEGALAGDAHLVAALDRLLDLAFHGQPGEERVLELALAWRRCGRPCATARCRRWSTRPSPGCGRRPRPRRRRRRPSARRGRSAASLLPPMLTNATFGPKATMVPSTVWPRSNCCALTDASNIAAKSSSWSLTGEPSDWLRRGAQDNPSSVPQIAPAGDRRTAGWREGPSPRM